MMRRALLLGFLATLAAPAADLPRRIVSLSPDVTEMLYGIGAFGQVAGVSDYCTYPPEVSRLPSVGGWHNPSLEKLAALRPDLLVSDVGQAPFIEDKVKALGLSMLVVPDHTVQDVYTAIASLGRATGHDNEAAKLVATTRERLLRVSQKTAGRTKPSVILIVNRTPGTLTDLYSATEGSYLAELVAIAGGRVTAPKAANGYGKLSKEDLLAINPEVILDFVHGTPSRFAADPIEAWREMPELRAVRARHVYGVNEDYVPHASQRIVDTAELFARLIHPELK
jgi:ABC-type Fe3+-hydroxamate transport system substrate-binding protein